MDSGIKEFYEKKNIFITGGSGFLGKVLIEKLLRTTEVSRIYVMLRSQRGKSIQERIDAWKDEPLFDLLLEKKPNAMERIVAIAGDCMLPDLGISIEDRALLTKETHVVIHSAATVNFTEPLKVAVDTNVKGTRLMVQLAREMQNLKAFVHVSTAFSNCVVQHLEERFYPDHLCCTVDKLLKLREICDDSVFNSMEEALKDKFPNTYVYTKALAEQVIQMEAEGMPVCIFRPGEIVATSLEPVSGWIDNIYGPIAFIYGTALGVLHVGLFNRKAQCPIVPVDHCASFVLASAWKTAKDSAKQKPHITSPDPTIYNFVPHKKNLFTNEDFMNAVEQNRYTCPLKQSLWYPFLVPTSNYWIFKLLTFFLHLVPGYLVDLVLRLRGQKPRLIKIYKKIHNIMDTLTPFSLQNWTFETINTDRLWQSMSPTDKQLFPLDMQSIDWDSYFLRALSGMRLYLGKEKPNDEALKHLNKLRIRHRILQFILLFCLAAFLLWFTRLFL